MTLNFTDLASSLISPSLFFFLFDLSRRKFSPQQSFTDLSRKLGRGFSRHEGPPELPAPPGRDVTILRKALYNKHRSEARDIEKPTGNNFVGVHTKSVSLNRGRRITKETKFPCFGPSREPSLSISDCVGH